MTIGQAIREGAERLQSDNVDAPQKTARTLLGHLLGLDQAQLICRSNDALSVKEHAGYLTLIARREAGEPLQYIVGHQEFFGLDFLVAPDVLIPRPETEFLVEQVINLANRPEMPSRPLIADLGTGSGCIAIAIAKHLQSSKIVATDLSAEALTLAVENAVRHGLENRIEFRQGDLLQPLLSNKGELDILCSNPPYVPEQLINSLQREVRDWEPRIALAGGTDGVDFYRRLTDDSWQFLRPEGYLVLEIGFSQLETLTSLIDGEIWKLFDVKADLQGIPRTITLRRN
jgi:release factor glutamine methyltransferase